MTERKDSGIVNTLWDSLQIPEEYDLMDEKARQYFLSVGIETLAQNMNNLGLRLSENVRLIDKLVNTPVAQKESISVDEFDEAGVGFEYVTDIFTWAYNMEINGRKISDCVAEGERNTAVAFLGKLDRYLNEKYNPAPTIKTRIKRLLKRS